MSRLSDLVLPGPQPPRGGLSILVPRGYEDNDDRQRGECYLCGERFAAGDNVIAHMRKCVHAAGHDVRQERAEKVDRLEVFLGPNAWDPEVSEHMRKVGERMRAEGRWEVKPSERAGFS